jgi:hypothetical protein
MAATPDAGAAPPLLPPPQENKPTVRADRKTAAAILRTTNCPWQAMPLLYLDNGIERLAAGKVRKLSRQTVV